MQTVIKWISEHFSDGFIYFSIAILTTYVVWFVAWVYFEKIKGVNKKVDSLPCAKHEDDLRKVEVQIEKKIAELPCKEHETAFKGYDSILKNFENKFSDIDKKQDKIIDILTKHEDRLGSLESNMTRVITILSIKDISTATAFSLKHSPSQLNEMGVKLFEECGGEKMLADNGDFFIKLMEKDNPETALDVENKAYEVLLSNSYMSIFNHLKQWVYNCPDWEIDSKKYTITMKDVCFVLSLHLRDMFLAKHPSIPTREE
ncbi:MAG: hypothetical protein KBS95_06255 [Alistipes sp.]|nr:hypothetical protein [Candidatus Alistipes equi]